MKPHLLNILAPIDFSSAGENALRLAIDLGRQHDATLHLIYVLENRYIMSGSATDINVFEMSREIKERARACLHEKYETISKKHNLRVQIHMPVGIPYDEICKVTDEIPIDLIVIGTHGRSGVKEFLAGSTTIAVLKNATKPVLTVPVYCKTTEFREILFPVRPVKGIIDKYQFMQSFLKGVESSVHIASLYLESEVEERLFLNDTKELFEMMPLINDTNLAFTKKLYVCNNFAGKVLDLSRTLPIDLIIINSCLDYSGLEFFVSPYTEQIIKHSKIPVLSFKNGFDLFKQNRQGKKARQYPFNNSNRTEV